MEGKIERERGDEKMEGREEGRQRAKEKIEVRKKRDAGRKEERKREKGVGIIEGRKLRKGIRTGKKKGRKEGWDGMEGEGQELHTLGSGAVYSLQLGDGFEMLEQRPLVLFSLFLCVSLFYFLLVVHTAVGPRSSQVPGHE